MFDIEGSNAILTYSVIPWNDTHSTLDQSNYGDKNTLHVNTCCLNH